MIRINENDENTLFDIVRKIAILKENELEIPLNIKCNQLSITPNDKNFDQLIISTKNISKIYEQPICGDFLTIKKWLFVRFGTSIENSYMRVDQMVIIPLIVVPTSVILQNYMIENKIIDRFDYVSILEFAKLTPNYEKYLKEMVEVYYKMKNENNEN